MRLNASHEACSLISDTNLPMTNDRYKTVHTARDTRHSHTFFLLISLRTAVYIISKYIFHLRAIDATGTSCILCRTFLYREPYIRIIMMSICASWKVRLWTDINKN